MNSAATDLRLEVLREFAERPESEFEWEDLLLRLELMPRALKVALEAGGGDHVPEILEVANDRELVVQQLLEEVAIEARPSQGTSHSPASFPESSSAPPAVSSESSSPSPAAPPAPSQRGSQPVVTSPNGLATTPSSALPTDAAVDRFVRLRGRNFAMLQRRGIDVWNWTVRVPPDGDATVFQLLSLLAREDVEILSRLRTARVSVPDAC